MTVAGTVSTPIASTDALTVTGDVNAPVASSGTFDVNAGGTVNLGGGTLTSSGPLNVRGTVSNGSASLNTNTTTLFATGRLPNTTVALPARLRGEGGVGGLTNNGTVEPVNLGNGNGATLQGGHAQSLTAELDAAPGALVQVAGNATLNGTLNINNYSPPGGCGNAATYLTAGGTISGIWSAVTPSTFTGGRFFVRPGASSAASAPSESRPRRR